MNPESDGTAIWLEKKFDVPASGQWDSELIFSIPLASSELSEGWPGLLVFECTSLEGMTDEIERFVHPSYRKSPPTNVLCRKYRVLDDCSRLRDIIDALPAKRHFIPFLLTISWIDLHIDNVVADFTMMVSKLVKDGILAGHQDFAITSEMKDLDGKLDQTLQLSALDLEGKLVQVLTVQGKPKSDLHFILYSSLSGVMKVLQPLWREFVSEWWESVSAVSNCKSLSCAFSVILC